MIQHDQVYRSWKTYGLDLLYWVYGHMPFLGEWMTLSSRAAGLLQAWYFISRARVQGDYIEFGVFRGDMFKLSLRFSRHCFGSTQGQSFGGKFIACDSFKGLPNVPSLKKQGNVFQAGEYASSLEMFKERIRPAVKREEIVILEGWFKDSLTMEACRRHSITKIAIANIDCDLYESAAECLNFLTPLVDDGTVLLFDDFFSIRGSMQDGEPLAAHEWCQTHPNIRLIPYMRYGVYGMMFLVNKTQSDSVFYVKS